LNEIEEKLLYIECSVHELTLNGYKSESIKIYGFIDVYGL